MRVTWSPDSHQIAYVCAHRGETNGSFIYIANADGTGQHRLSTGDGYDFSPSWSPDGRTIAFSRIDNQNAAAFDLYLTPVDTYAPKKLTRLNRTGPAPASHSGPDFSSPTWSPDGKTLAFWGYDQSIYVIGIDGMGFRKLSIPKSGISWPMNPSWYPAGPPPPGL
jgi:TolB protein